MSDSASLAAAAAAWLADPAVLADPAQHGAEGVWTRAEDILPGAEVHEDSSTVAAWGSLTWRARARWDAHELDILWLVQDGPASAPPHLDVAAATEHLVQRLLGVLTHEGARWHPRLVPGIDDGGCGRTERLPAELAAVLRPELEDVARAVATLVEEVNRGRTVTREALTTLARLSPRLGRALVRTGAGRRVYRWARLTAPGG